MTLFKSKYPGDIRSLQEFSNFIVAVALMLVIGLVPDMAAAATTSGGFLGNTGGFEGDVQKTWTLVSYVGIFGGLIVMVIGMFLPIASWMKWGAIGAVIVGAFGQSIVTYLYDVGGNTGAVGKITGTGN